MSGVLMNFVEFILGNKKHFVVLRVQHLTLSSGGHLPIDSFLDRRNATSGHSVDELQNLTAVSLK